MQAHGDPDLAVVALDPRAQRYADCNETKLRRTLARRDAMIVTLRSRIKNFKRKHQGTRRHGSHRSHLAIASPAPLAPAPETTLAVHRPKKSSWLDSRSFVALGLRRNLSNIGAKDVGPLCLIKVSRWTVNRAELVAAAALQAAARSRIAAGSSVTFTEIDKHHLVEDLAAIVSRPPPLLSSTGLIRNQCIRFRIGQCSSWLSPGISVRGPLPAFQAG